MSIQIFVPTQAQLDERTVASASSTPSFPTVTGGIQAGDRIVAFGVSGGSNATGFSSPTTGTGWSQVDQHCSTGNTLAPAIAVFERVATGGESGTVTMPHGNIITTCGIIVIRGLDATTPHDISPSIDDKTTVNTQIQVVPPAGVTLLTDGVLGLYIFTMNSTTTAATPPAGWTEDCDRNTALTGNRSFTVGHRSDIPAGALAAANGAWGGSTRDVGITLWYRPAVTDTGIYRLDGTHAVPVLTPVAMTAL